jgi:hypothetical protein
MSDTYNSPKVRVRYRASGFDAEFDVGWSARDGHDAFRTGLIALLDGLHETWNRNELHATYSMEVMSDE